MSKSTNTMSQLATVDEDGFVKTVNKKSIKKTLSLGSYADKLVIPKKNSRASYYKTIMCRHIINHGHWYYESAWLYAHSEKEQRKPTDPLPAKIIKMFEDLQGDNPDKEFFEKYNYQDVNLDKESDYMQDISINYEVEDKSYKQQFIQQCQLDGFKLGKKPSQASEKCSLNTHESFLSINQSSSQPNTPTVSEINFHKDANKALANSVQEYMHNPEIETTENMAIEKQPKSMNGFEPILLTDNQKSAKNQTVEDIENDANVQIQKLIKEKQELLDTISNWKIMDEYFG